MSDGGTNAMSDGGPTATNDASAATETTATVDDSDRTIDEIDPTTQSEKGQLPLSVVIIAENEEDNIGDCIESVFAACRSVSAFEVILVDSASTDRTVEIAREYPVTVLRIPDEHTVSCGAGRFVGDQVARGELVLHVDGDMTLTDDWLPAAIAYLQDHEETVGVEGWLDDAEADTIIEVNKIGGVTLYDAAALAAVGGFDPFLRGYEDIDVGFQLTTIGKRLVRLPAVSAIHDDEDGISEPLRRWRQGYFVALGQTVRKHLDSPASMWLLAQRQRFEIALLAWAVAGVVSLVSLSLFGVWLLGSAVGFALIVNERGATGAVDFVTRKALGIAGIASGVRQPPRPAAEYPLAAIEVVAAGRVLNGSPLEKPAASATAGSSTATPASTTTTTSASESAEQPE